MLPRPPDDSVREQLEKILSSKPFRTSDRQQLLLRYIVEKTLEGHPFKERDIGIDGLKKKDFSPTFDSGVRTAVRELRGKLDKYFRSDGHADPIRVEIPEGGYRASFKWFSGAELVQPQKNQLVAGASLLGYR